jgi:hypothetical protein
MLVILNTKNPEICSARKHQAALAATDSIFFSLSTSFTSSQAGLSLQDEQSEAQSIFSIASDLP